MLALLIAWGGTGYVYEAYTTDGTATVDAGSAGEPVSDTSLARLQARQRQLRRTLVRLAPRGLYIVIDQTNNRLYLRKDQDVILEAVCSAGSGMALKEGEGARQWVIDTPRGRFQVITNVENPTWKKPDWAFVD